MPKNNQNASKLQRLSLGIFRRPRTTAIVWLFISIFGILSYTTLLQRQGFPKIETPFAIAQGVYAVNDAAKVDSEVAKPLGSFLLKQAGVESVQIQSFANNYVANVSYKEGTNAADRSRELAKAVTDQKLLPAQATVNIEPFALGFTERGDDIAIAYYSADGTASTQGLVQSATQAAEKLKSEKLSLVSDVSIINPLETATNPLSGQSGQTQNSFSRFGERANEQNRFYSSVVIGVKAADGADELELDKQVRAAVDKLNQDQSFSQYHAEISGSNATGIRDQISELQRTLLEGLLAVLVVGSLIIAIRASLITVLSMITVIAVTNGILYLTGYSLNTITLFGLILGLSLIVDDTVIMVEALDAQRRRRKNPEEIVSVATGKVSTAMIAATSTAALSFAPLLFVGGILGTFIRAIPITIISALVVSLLVSLFLIPFFARFILLRKTGEQAKSNAPIAKMEAGVAQFVSRPMLWAKGSRAKLFGVGIGALIIGFGFIAAGGFLFQKVTFNIFPSAKDANLLSVTLNFNPGTSIDQAQAIADKADTIVGDVTGSNFVKADYYAVANNRQATLQADIIDYKKRDVTGPQLVEQLNDRFKNFDGATAEARQIDAGPPPSMFTARVASGSNRANAERLATDIGNYLKSVQLQRPDGSIATIKNVMPPNPALYNRDGDQAYINVTASFNDSDTTTLVTLAQDAVKKEFPEERIQSYGLSNDALSFDFGQESENQDSFKTLALAFPLLLLVIYLVLAIQFRSLLQPILIFMAIPFSLLGITLGLYLTDNAFSFFAALGFFALIGLSIKNTILLTDYANQSRKAGMHSVDAAHEAVAERFRPLLATSLTAVVSLIPLALTSPFWEGLAVVLIFGLLSSTFLVVTVFPYYYLGAEFMRTYINRRTGLLWFFGSLILSAGLVLVQLPQISWVGPIAVALAIIIYKRLRYTSR